MEKGTFQNHSEDEIQLKNGKQTIINNMETDPPTLLPVR